MKDETAATIRLSQFLKGKGLCGTGGEAKIVLPWGYVGVNVGLETRRGGVLVVVVRLPFQG